MHAILSPVWLLIVIIIAQGQGSLANDGYQLETPTSIQLEEQFKRMNWTVMIDVNNSLTLVDMAQKLRPIGFSLKNRYNVTEDINFYFYSRKNIELPANFKLGNLSSLLKQEMFDVSKKTIFLVHGYLNNLTSPMIQESVKAAMESMDANVIAVDWYQVMRNEDNVYSWCADATYPVGRAIGEAICNLMSGGLRKSDVHMVGHSLGAHVVGIAGKYLNEQNLTVARITGLDPAKVGFEEASIDKRIDGGDADFVDCIHTCGGYLGFDQPICQADFYPNGGTLQPGCSILGDICCVCSHGRSYQYFAESIIPEHLFPTSKCVWVSQELHDCKNSSQVMGYPAMSQYTGVFYTITEYNFPYSPMQAQTHLSWWQSFKLWFMSINIITG